MKTLYLDCGMGAAGDMLTAALLELHPDPEKFLQRLNCIGIPGVETRRIAAASCGITGSRISVLINGREEDISVHADGHHHEHHHEHDHEHDHHNDHDHEHKHHDHDHAHEHHHEHHGMADIQEVVASLDVPEQVKNDILAVYGLIAEAESKAHGCDVSEIHFHEVGTMDAIADITAVCLLIRELAPDRILASPVCTGSGHVHCIHGILPVPAPATAWLLRGIPIYAGKYESELCTPTGAALLKHFVSDFCEMPVMRVNRIGYGIGKKEFPAANCVRAMLGDSGNDTDMITELVCTIDDMTGEELACAAEKIMEAGAKDVYTAPVYMKKGRPGIEMNVLCSEEAKKAVIECIFRHTETIGMRERICRRYVLPRSVLTAETPYGQVRYKVSEADGIEKKKTEFDDIRRIASEQGVDVHTMRRELDKYI